MAEMTPAHQALAVELSAQIHAVMERRGYSQRRVAMMAGVTPQTVLNILKTTHSVRLDTLVAVASALGCEVRVALHRPNN